MKHTTPVILGTFLAVLFLAAPLQAQIISVDFYGGNMPLPILTAADVAGAVPAANWNIRTQATGTDMMDSAGAATTLDYAWTGGGNWRATATSQTNPDSIMLNGILETLNGNLNLTRIPYEQYDIYVYFSEQQARDGTLTLGATTYYFNTSNNVSALNQVTSTTPGVYEQGNYVIFSGLSGASQSINMAGAINVGLAGFQVVAVPEPSTAALAGAGLGGLVLLRRKRK